VTPIEPSELFPDGVVPAWVELFAGDRDRLRECLEIAVGPLPLRSKNPAVPKGSVEIVTLGATVTTDRTEPEVLLDLARAALSAWIYATTPDRDPRRPNRKIS
jgi:hypothetical protein